VALRASLGFNHGLPAAVAEAHATAQVVVALDRPGHGDVPL
jgi:hypothetical protein